LARALLDVEGTTAVRLGDDGLLDVETARLDALQSALPEIAARERAGVRSLSVSDASLDALFDDLVGGAR
jgi:hypothetical protein